MGSNQRSKPINAVELIEQLKADPEYQRRKAEHSAGVQQRAEMLRRAERPIVEDLQRVGLQVSSVWDLVNTATPYPDALPVLLEHLSRGGYPDRVMESLGRALAVKPSVFAWDTMRDLYRRARSEGEQTGLALALAASATAEHLDTLVGLVLDESLGESRIFFLTAIKKLGRERGKEFLETLREDAFFGREATALLKPRRRR